MPERSITPPDMLPEPTAEMVLLRICVEGFIATSSRKRGERFVRFVAETLAEESNLASVLRLRPSAKQPAMCKAMAGALTTFETWAPKLLARLPRE